MQVREIIRSAKSIQQPGRWAAGAMPKTAFPLSKSGSKAYKLGNWRWRVVTFNVAGLNCRLLVNYHPALLQYQAMLGVDIGGDTKVLVCLEHHPTHKPWHAHVCCDDVNVVPSGMRRGPWMRSVNGTGAKHRMPCPATDEAAFNRAVSFFRLDRNAGGSLI